MNREIKFRHWSGLKMEYFPCLHEWNTEYCDINPENLMQFTGLHDKNGKEIYEGDVFKTCVENIKYYYVCFEEGSFVMKYKLNGKEFIWGKIDRCIELLKEWNLFEVICNIYENTELLK